MDVNIEMILLWALSYCIWVLYNAMSTTECSLHKHCTVTCVKLAFLLALNYLGQTTSPIKVNVQFKKMQTEDSYKDDTENSEIDKNGKSLEKENDLQMEDKGMPKVLKMFYFNPNSLNIGCCL